MLAGKNRNMAYSRGIWMSWGMQPARGLTPLSRYSFIVACCRSMASSWSGYLALIASMSGLRTRILAELT